MVIIILFTSQGIPLHLTFPCRSCCPNPFCVSLGIFTSFTNPTSTVCPELDTVCSYGSSPHCAVQGSQLPPARSMLSVKEIETCPIK